MHMNVEAKPYEGYSQLSLFTVFSLLFSSSLDNYSFKFTIMRKGWILNHEYNKLYHEAG